MTKQVNETVAALTKEGFQVTPRHNYLGIPTGEMMIAWQEGYTTVGRVVALDAVRTAKEVLVASGVACSPIKAVGTSARGDRWRYIVASFVATF